MSDNPLTPIFRVSYPNVFTPKKNDLNGKDEYSVVALFEKGANITGLKKAAQEALIKKFGADKTKWPAVLKTPFRDQAERVKNVDGKMILPAAHVAGAVFMNLKSKDRPAVVDQNVEDIIDQSQFYAGCYARASVRAYAYDMKGNRGVAFGLQNIQKVKDGEPLSGRAKPEDEFAPVEMDVEASTDGESAGAGSIFDLT